jgi:(R)-2-hydroxyacyl-CoA dehydratese activating ATPase
MIHAGVDIGSRTIDIVLFDGEKILGSCVTETGVFPKDKARQSFQQLLKQSGIREAASIFTTGYGRNYFEGATEAVSEIVCHAAGAAFLFPQVRTVIDIGGQDSRVIQTGESGKVQGFIMNDRCAAGTGKFIEMVAKTLDIPLEETGKLSLSVTEPCDISSMCAVFAESEIIGLLHQGVSRERILAGVLRSVVRRILGMGRQLSLAGPVVFTGGVARNEGVLHALKEESKIVDIRVPENPQITGALGAAILSAKKQR